MGERGPSPQCCIATWLSSDAMLWCAGNPAFTMLSLYQTTMTSFRLLRLFTIIMALALSGCIGSPDSGRDAPASTNRVGTARGPVAPQTEAARACFGQLNSAGIGFTPLPDQEMAGGCHARGAVRLSDIGTPTSNLGPMTCTLASNFAAWVRHAVAPAARQVFDEDIARIETFGTYSCRNINGGNNATAGRLSQHAFANAVDVSAFVLTDGRRISVLAGWNGDDREQRFLRLIHSSACRRFSTVLSPDYNAAHANHFHFDMGGRAGAQNFCR